MRAWQLRLKSLVVQVDWWSEAIEAYLAPDWDAFGYALRRDRELLGRTLLHEQYPLNLMIESGRVELVRRLVECGADPGRTSTGSIPAGGRWRQRRTLDPRERSLLRTGHSLPFMVPVRANCLVIAWAGGASEVYEYLWSVAPAGTRYDAACVALMLDDEEWLATLDLPSVFRAAEQGDPAMPPPLVAAVLGGCSRATFARVRDACSTSWRERRYTESPGYGHDLDPVYAGDAGYWASLCKRPDLLDELK